MTPGKYTLILLDETAGWDIEDALLKAGFTVDANPQDRLMVVRKPKPL